MGQLVSKPSKEFVDFWKTTKLTMKDLITTGIFVKTCDIIQTKNTDNRPKKIVEMYKISTDQGIRFTCDPMTKELTSKRSLQLNDFLNKTKSTVEELISSGAFVKMCDVIVIMERSSNSKEFITWAPD